MGASVFPNLIKGSTGDGYQTLDQWSYLSDLASQTNKKDKASIKSLPYVLKISRDPQSNRTPCEGPLCIIKLHPEDLKGLVEDHGTSKMSHLLKTRRKMPRSH